MRNFLFLLALASSVAGWAEDSVRVEGQKAKSLIVALTAVGAKKDAQIEQSFWRVSNVVCEYTPNGYIYAQCKLKDDNDNRKVLLPFTGKALDLYNALVKAGAIRASEPPTNSVFATKLTCETGFGSSDVTYKCEILRD